MKLLSKLFYSAAIAGSLVLASCDDNENDSNDTSVLTLNLKGLESLGDGFAYEGWIMVDGAPKSTGTFTVDGAGKLSATTFMIDEDDLAAATAFVLSIEPSPDTDPAPAATKLLVGEFSGNTASVSTGTVGSDFDKATGKFIVKTPTTTTTDDDYSGIWFLDNSGAMMEAGLDLPELSPGWKYEGWVVIDGTPVTTGTFTMTDKADDAAPFSGSDASGPAFPGEDFIMNAPSGLTFPTDIQGGTAVISIEPDPDNSAAPFVLKPLVKMIPDPATGVIGMDNNTSASFPSGSVSR